MHYKMLPQKCCFSKGILSLCFKKDPKAEAINYFGPLDQLFNILDLRSLFFSSSTGSSCSI